MSKEDTQQALVPRLRFPEFRNAPEWEEKQLKQICEVNPTNGPLPDSFIYIDLESVDGGILKARRRISKVDAPSRAQRLLANGDVIFQIVRPYQRNNLFIQFDDDEAYVASTGYAQLRANDNSTFLYYLVHTDPFVNKVIASCTGSSYPAINSDDLAALTLSVPLRPAEQRKIAACLGSLDDLIAAEGRKLAALRDHKKGLMQQLFPREGETQPRLRFPEFHNAGEWTPHKFGDFVVNSFYGTSASTSETGQYPVLRMGNMSDGGLDFADLVYIDLDPEEFESFRLQKGDILLNRTNSRDLVGKISIFDRDFECITASYIVSFRMDEKRIDPQFCNLMLNTQMYQSRIKLLATPSVSQANINPTTFRTGLDIAVPKLAEQQRIADFLSALDALIVAQAEKLDALRTHKRGLMQQLFPSPEDHQ